MVQGDTRMTGIQSGISKKNKVIASLISFLYYAAAAAIMPYFNLVFRNKGLSIEQIGILILIPRLLSLFSVMIWGAISDTFRLQKFVLPLSMGLTIPFIAATFHFNEYTPVLVYYSIYSFCSAPLAALVDTTIVDLIGDDYGKARVWGSIGWGLVSIATGHVADSFGLESTLWLYVLLMGIGVVVAFFVPDTPKIESEPFWKNINLIGKDKRWIGFLLTVTLSGYGLQIIANYGPLFLEDLGASVSFIGYTNVTSIIGELPVFFLTPWMLKKFDKTKLIMFSLFCMFLRCGFFAIIKSPQPALFIQMLHALSYALLMSAGVAFVREISPKGFGASGQALFSTMYTGAGGIIAAIGGSILYDYHGPHTLFLSGAIAALLAIAIMGVFFQRKPQEAVCSTD